MQYRKKQDNYSVVSNFAMLICYMHSTDSAFTLHAVIFTRMKHTYGSYGNHVCLHGELWLHGWPNLGNAQVRLALAALVYANGGPTVTIKSVVTSDINRNTKILQLASKMLIYAEKCDLRTLLKYAKMRQSHIG